MYELELNLAKKDNFMFFDFEAPLALSVTKYRGWVNRLTPRILAAIKSGKLILINKEMKIGGENDGKVQEEKGQEITIEENVDEKTDSEVLENVDETSDNTDKEVKPKRTRKSKEQQ